MLIAGPTASGKSALALNVAREIERSGRRPVIINADSMQVYRELRILSARPNEAEQAGIPHLLYGFVGVREVFSTGRWLEEIARCLFELDNDEVPIITGGTGLYFKALIEGFAEIPPISDKIRRSLRDELHSRGAEAMHQRLAVIDEASARELNVNDTQRVLRALEVVEETGKSILDWQSDKQRPAMIDGASCRKIIALPDRAVLYERINQRFNMMMDEGALEEVETLSAMELAPDLPAMKAIGMQQLRAHLAGDLNLDEAIENAKRESRRYAKRQMTWLRNQMGEDWQRIVSF